MCCPCSAVDIIEFLLRPSIAVDNDPSFITWSAIPTGILFETPEDFVRSRFVLWIVDKFDLNFSFAGSAKLFEIPRLGLRPFHCDHNDEIPIFEFNLSSKTSSAFETHSLGTGSI
jgi:hypothetical protein